MRGQTIGLMLTVVVLGISESAQADPSWTTPVPVAEVNTAYSEGAPFLSYDGLSLYFSRQGVPGSYPGRLYSASRLEPSGAFTSEEELAALNTSGSVVNYSWVSPDNLRLYYYKTPHEILISERASISDPWSAGVSVPELNALGGVANPSLTPDELTIVFTGSSVPGGLGGYDIWMGTRTDRYSPFGDFTNLSEVNSSAWDYHPRLSSDGLTLYFGSQRNDAIQIYTATRPSLEVLFGTPELLSFPDWPGGDLWYPAISGDGQALYFTKTMSDGSHDVYVSEVVPLPGAALLGVLGLTVAGTKLRRRREI